MDESFEIMLYKLYNNINKRIIIVINININIDGKYRNYYFPI